MAQFDVYRTGDGDLLVDCQSDSLGHLATRMVAPLLPADRAPPPRARLNPTFEIDGTDFVLVIQFAAAVGAAVLRTRVTSLSSRRFDIVGAFDMLLTGV